MIKTLAKVAVMLLTITAAKEALAPMEEEHPKVKGWNDGTSLDWFLFSLGAIVGLGIEAGTNLGNSQSKHVQCFGQTSDMIEALYFTYFYIY